MSDLKVTIVQTTLFWEDKKSNLEMLSAKIDAAPDTDLIVLPEMFSTGFSMKPEQFAETMDGATVEWMRQKAKEKGCVITGSFIAQENGNYYNRLLWMQPDGTYSAYDKRHLFGMADEHKHYSAGTNKLQVELKGWKILPLVCYDLRFPVWSRNHPHAPYDLAIYVANWPERRYTAWKTLLSARAIENQSYVIGVNRIGEDGNGISHSGDSVVVDPLGEPISKTQAHEENIETLVLSKETISELRKRLPFLKDADGFRIL